MQCSSPLPAVPEAPLSKSLTLKGPNTKQALNSSTPNLVNP